MKHAFVLVSLVAASAATAAPKPLAAAKHEPPVWLDAARNLIRIFGHSDGYQLLGEFRVAGVTSTTDRVRMEVRSGAKVVSKVDCRLREWKEEEKYVDAMCDTESNLTASGPLKVSIVYIDDQTDKEYLAETLELTIKAWNSGGVKGWTMTPDDLLALAWVIPNASGFNDTSFFFWSTSKGKTNRAVLRCTVDGEKIDDIKATLGRHNDFDEVTSGFDNHRPKDKREYFYRYTQVQAKITKLVNGSWDCMVRQEGALVRQLMFTVTDDGIAPSSMQSGKRPIRTTGNRVLVDSRIPKAKNQETRIRPDALKRSIGYGVAWPDGPGAKAAQAAFPAAVGKD